MLSIRPLTGNCSMRTCSTVLETTAFSTTIIGLTSVTLTEVVEAPGLRTGSRTTFSAARTIKPPRNRSMPGAMTDTRYGPAIVPGKKYRPASLVWVLNTRLVAVFSSVTATLGITAPLRSRTVPLTVLVLACDQTEPAVETTANRRISSLFIERNLLLHLSTCQLDQTPRPFRLDWPRAGRRRQFGPSGFETYDLTRMHPGLPGDAAIVLLPAARVHRIVCRVL